MTVLINILLGYGMLLLFYYLLTIILKKWGEVLEKDSEISDLRWKSMMRDLRVSKSRKRYLISKARHGKKSNNFQRRRKIK